MGAHLSSAHIIPLGAKPPWQDLIDEFLEFSDGHISPDSFKLWSCIGMIAGALERRVWVEQRGGAIVTFPNLFVLLVAPPGVGKYVIEAVRGLWSDVMEPGTKSKAFKVAPDSMTKASLIDNLVKARTVKIVKDGPPLAYHSLLVAAEEFAVLLPSYDLEYIAALNSIYNNKTLHEETRRFGVKEVRIDYPQMNILAGTQPSWLGATFPQEAWSSGLARRLIMVFATESPLIDIFAAFPDASAVRERILQKLSILSTLHGKMVWADEAQDKLGKWYLDGQGPLPGHSKLSDYNKSRPMFLAKLSMISAIARTGSFLIEKEDVDRAMTWLFDAERVMPDIFRAMIGKSDRQIIEELHVFMTKELGRGLKVGGKRGITGGAIRYFLLDRIPHDKIESILRACESSNVLGRVEGTMDLWIPKAKNEFGVE